MKKRIISLLLCFSLLLCPLCSCESYADLKSGRLTVHFLDVGQGDCILIELPNRETMLIDSGDSYYGEGIVQYLRDRECARIDHLISTHPHSDHIGSMAYVVRHFKTAEAYMPKVAANTLQFEELLNTLKDEKVSVKSGRRGVNIVKDEELDLSVDIIAPSEPDDENLNDSSLILRIVYKKASFLFTGDAEENELSALEGDYSADVLKVGHHGSYTSTTKEFLDAVKPEIAVISCGLRNDYGHPHTDVLRLLKQAKCRIYRTDKQGTVAVSTDGEAYTVETGLKSLTRAIY